MRNKFLFALPIMLLASCGGPRWSEVKTDNGYNLVTQKKGRTLAYAPGSGVTLLTVDGYAFKDLNRNGILDPYEDWRLSARERAQDLASKLSIEQIAGMMLYSSHQSVPSESWSGVYDGKIFAESSAASSDLSDNQKKFLTEDNLRAVLVTTVESPAAAARWNNNMQMLVEGMGCGVPVNISSDPRHETSATAEYNYGSGGDISHWPTSLGLAATFDPALVEEFGRIAADEYRALGIATALSPQIDLATEPRWTRFYGTFGESPELDTDMARAYVDGFQTSYGEDEIADGWGYRSVNAMVKHWPSGGPEEGGRDAHYNYGKYAVYPGGCFQIHKIPFVKGAFDLKRGTGASSAVMPYYTIPYGQTDENVANGYNSDILLRQLREEGGYEGGICTDWLVTHDEVHPGIHSGKPWGVENLSVAERHYKALMAGVDQFGGNNEIEPVLQAYQMGVEEHGEEWMRRRFEESAYRLLLNMFRVGLFENPYIDVCEADRVVGSPEFMEAGYRQQLKSIVMLKNKGNLLPLSQGSKVYIPRRISPEGPNYWRQIIPQKIYDPVPESVVSRDFIQVEDAGQADVAIVFVESPHSYLMGYDNGYIPISLQYGDYVAEDAREHSIAGGDPFEETSERSYRGKSARTINKCDMELVHRAREEMGQKPVIVVINMLNPMVMKEIEPYADAVIAVFDVQAQAVMDIVSGRCEPSGLLPFQLPIDMSAVELHCEDKPHDMLCYCDTQGHFYDFAFGMNFKGVIDDERVRKYRRA